MIQAMITFTSCFDLVVSHEGGFGADPKDRGNWTSGICGQGELRGTKYGISAASYPELDIKSLTLDDAKAIYQRDFWQRLNIDELPEGLRYWVFDASVNHGVGFAGMSIQRAAGALPDGQIGPRTCAAVSTKAPNQLLRLMFCDRMMVYGSNPNFRHFGPGWCARLHDVFVLSLTMIDPRLKKGGV